jgi:hypothetical protein
MTPIELVNLKNQIRSTHKKVILLDSTLLPLLYQASDVQLSALPASNVGLFPLIETSKMIQMKSEELFESKARLSQLYFMVKILYGRHHNE